MIKTFTKVDELNKILRKSLITQSELPSKRVINSLSTYGETLDKILNNSIVESYELSDVVLLFQLDNRINTSDTSFTDESDNITYVQSYILKVILYGKMSFDVANKIVARFRTEKNRESLYEQGIYIEKIENPTSFIEFKNNVLWPRCDINILLSCEFSYSQVEQDYDIDNISKLQISET